MILCGRGSCRPRGQRDDLWPVPRLLGAALSSRLAAAQRVLLGRAWCLRRVDKPSGFGCATLCSTSWRQASWSGRLHIGDPVKMKMRAPCTKISKALKRAAVECHTGLGSRWGS